MERGGRDEPEKSVVKGPKTEGSVPVKRVGVGPTVTLMFEVTVDSAMLKILTVLDLRI
jgi:hypothetical protein